MASYLFVAFLGGGTLLEVQPSEDGVLAVTLFDLQLCFLHPTFFVAFGLFLLLLFLQRFIIRKEIQLLGDISIGSDRRLRYHMIRGQVQPANQQVWIHTTVEERGRRALLHLP